jgi:parallel beta-helix repeat protein
MTRATPKRTNTIPAAQGVRYDPARNAIVLSKAEPTTLAAVSAALGRSEVLSELRPGEWLLSANLEIHEGASLTIASPESRWLKLRSDRDGFVAIKALGGRLTITDACLSSWDAFSERVDEQLSDGRSFILARDGGWLSIRRSHLHHLGYDANESYGVALRLAGTRGEIIESELAYNYYGLYTNQVSGLIIRGNNVHHSLLYGIDPHTSSSDLLIENNISHHNGKHGIILAEGCSNSIIRNNTVYNNTLHGIVLYNNSNNNRVEGNISYGNGEQGINLNHVSDTIVLNNTVYENTSDGIGIGQKTKHTAVVGNTVRNNRGHGIHLYSDAEDTSIEANQIIGNQRYGVYLKSSGNRITTGNRIIENAVGVVAQAADVTEQVRAENEIDRNHEADVRTIDE